MLELTVVNAGCDAYAAVCVFGLTVCRQPVNKNDVVAETKSMILKDESKLILQFVLFCFVLFCFYCAAKLIWYLTRTIAYIVLHRITGFSAEFCMNG